MARSLHIDYLVNIRDLSKEEIDLLSTGQLIDILGDNWQVLIDARRKWNWNVIVPTKQLRKALADAVYKKSRG